jgi:hypothetical protein
MSTSQATTQLIARLTDAFEFLMDGKAQNVAFDEGADAPATIADCVPLMAIALELIGRGPTSISVEGVENYRAKVMHLLAQIRPVIEQEAKTSLADWTRRLAAEPQYRRRAA